MGATPGFNKVYKAKLVKAGTIKCGLCRYNRGENEKRRPQDDRYKDHRKS